MSTSGHLATEERLAWLQQRLEADGRIHIAAAAADLQVSDMTIRRDLLQLEGRGVARRVRGGALALGPAPFADRHRLHAAAKGRIAAKLVDLIPDAGAVAFDASSTVLRLAAALDGARDLTVVTNGPETFQALQDRPGVHPLVTGGALEPRTGSLVGPLACRAARTVVLDRFVASAAGLDPEVGPTEACIEEAEVKLALASVASEVVLAVDASKLGTRAVATTFDWDHVDLLVTDLEPGDRRLDPYRDRVAIR